MEFLGRDWVISGQLAVSKKNGFHGPLPFANCGLPKFLDTDPDKRRKQGSNKQKTTPGQACLPTKAGLSADRQAREALKEP
ncbi:MAG: hypothetical protein R3306_08320 [Arenibacter algicola]|nr:hypothetical protein [Arenibacter algicola]